MLDICWVKPEMKAVSAQAESFWVYVKQKNIYATHAWHYYIVVWLLGDTVVHLLLLKSSMVKLTPCFQYASIYIYSKLPTLTTPSPFLSTDWEWRPFCWTRWWSLSCWPEATFSLGKSVACEKNEMSGHNLRTSLSICMNKDKISVTRWCDYFSICGHLQHWKLFQWWHKFS